MKKFFITIFIFSFCFLDINPALISKAFSLTEETLISLNDKNISDKLLDLFFNRLTKGIVWRAVTCRRMFWIF